VISTTTPRHFAVRQSHLPKNINRFNNLQPPANWCSAGMLRAKRHIYRLTEKSLMRTITLPDMALLACAASMLVLWEAGPLRAMDKPGAIVLKLCQQTTHLRGSAAQIPLLRCHLSKADPSR
jgi:hypothetical protein